MAVDKPAVRQCGAGAVEGSGSGAGQPRTQFRTRFGSCQDLHCLQGGRAGPPPALRISTTVGGGDETQQPGQGDVSMGQLGI